MAGQHYNSGTIAQTSGWMETEVYSAVLDAMPVACADILIRDEHGNVLLGLRSRDPHPDWWIFGGRHGRGLTFEQAAQANLQRELGLNVEITELRYVASYSTVFSRRAHAPMENGTHTINSLCEIVLTAEQIRSMHPNDEYRETRWVTEAALQADVEFHPLLRQALTDARSSSNGERLVALAAA